MRFIDNPGQLDVCGTITTKEGTRRLDPYFKTASHGVVESE